MQTTIYYKESDEYLIEKLEEMADRQRRSRSACILSILEECFEADKQIGEILQDMGALSKEELQKAREKQKEEKEDKKIGEIIREEDYAEKAKIDRALEIQKK